MDIYLMRHGDAAEAARDAQRPLSDKGRSQALSSAKALKRLGATAPVIWHSPFVRAQQTAAIVADVFGTALVADDRLVPNGDGDAVARWLLGERQGGIVVAHLPILPYILHALTGGAASFSTAGVAHVTVVGGHATLSGLYAANALEHMQ